MYANFKLPPGDFLINFLWHACEISQVRGGATMFELNLIEVCHDHNPTITGDPAACENFCREQGNRKFTNSQTDRHGCRELYILAM